MTITNGPPSTLTRPSRITAWTTRAPHHVDKHFVKAHDPAINNLPLYLRVITGDGNNNIYFFFAPRLSPGQTLFAGVPFALVKIPGKTPLPAPSKARPKAAATRGSIIFLIYPRQKLGHNPSARPSKRPPHDPLLIYEQLATTPPFRSPLLRRRSYTVLARSPYIFEVMSFFSALVVFLLNRSNSSGNQNLGKFHRLLLHLPPAASRRPPAPRCSWRGGGIPEPVHRRRGVR
jgi:hypothetical protein